MGLLYLRVIEYKFFGELRLNPKNGMGENMLTDECCWVWLLGMIVAM